MNYVAQAARVSGLCFCVGWVGCIIMKIDTSSVLKYNYLYYKYYKVITFYVLIYCYLVY